MSEGGGLLPGQRATILAFLNARTMPVEERIGGIVNVVLSCRFDTRQRLLEAIAEQLCFTAHPELRRTHGACDNCCNWVIRASGIRG